MFLVVPRRDFFFATRLQVTAIAGAGWEMGTASDERVRTAYDGSGTEMVVFALFQRHAEVVAAQ